MLTAGNPLSAGADLWSESDDEYTNPLMDSACIMFINFTEIAVDVTGKQSFPSQKKCTILD